MHSNAICLVSCILVVSAICGGKSDEACKNVALGSPVTIKCEINNGVQRGTKALDITWKAKIEQDDDWVPISNTSDTVMRACRRSHHHEDCSKNNVLSVLYLRNFTHSDIATYSCFTEDEEIDRIRLEFECPLPVYLPKHGCVYRSVTEDFRCCWERTAALSHAYTNFTMSTGWNSVKYINYSDCNTSDVICCGAVIGSTYDMHHVTLIAKYGNTSVKSITYDRSPFSHVQPVRPKISKVTPIHENGRLSIRVEWTEPDDELYSRNYEYRLRYRNNESVSAWKEKETTAAAVNSAMISDENLQPYTIYAIQVAARPNGFFVSGVWSEWSRNAFVRTSLTAPRQKLKFTSPIITKVRHDGTTYNSVKMNWIRYIHPDEDEFVTKISCGAADEQETVYKSRDKTSAVFHTTSDEIDCWGKFCNKLGCSNTTAFKRNLTSASRHFPMSPENVSVNSSVLQFGYESSNKSQTLRARICSRFRSSGTEIDTILEPHNECLVGEFSTDYVTTIDVSNRHVEIKRKWSPCQQYIVILETEAIDSIIWKSAASQIAQYDPNYLKNVGFAAVDSSTSRKASIRVSWTKFTDNEFMYRQLRYQSVGGSECDASRRCYRTFCHDIAPRNATTVILAENVFGNTDYEVKEWLVCSESPFKHDDKHQHPYAFEVPGNGQSIRTAITRPGKPTQLSLSPQNSLKPVLSWTPPLHTNGHPEYKISQFNPSGDVRTASVNKLTQATVDISCDHINDTFSFVVTAINEASDETLQSDSDTLEYVYCIEAGDEYTKNVSAIVALVVIVTLCVVSLIILCFCWKRIKQKLKLRFSIPSPAIDQYVINDGAVGFAKEAFESYDESETYCSVVSGPNLDEVTDQPDCDKNFGTSREHKTNFSKALQVHSTVSEQSGTDPNSEYVTEEAAASIEYVGRRKRTISTASTLPAYTSSYDIGVKQYVKVANTSRQQQSGDFETALLQGNFNVSKSDYACESKYATAENHTDSEPKYSEIQQSPSNVTASISEKDLSASISTSNSLYNEQSCPVDYIPDCSQMPTCNVPSQNSVQSLLSQQSVTRHSSSSSGIFEDYNGCEDSLKEEMTNFLTTCIPAISLAASRNDSDKAKTEGGYRKDETHDAENSSLLEDVSTSREGYVDFERATLLSAHV